jgi:hypothetical protein
MGVVCYDNPNSNNSNPTNCTPPTVQQIARLKALLTGQTAAQLKGDDGSAVPIYRVYGNLDTNQMNVYYMFEAPVASGGSPLDTCNSNSGTPTAKTTTSRLLAEAIAKLVGDTAGPTTATATFNLPGCEKSAYSYKDFGVKVGDVGLVYCEGSDSYSFATFKEGTSIANSNSPDNIGEATGVTCSGKALYIVGGPNSSPPCWGQIMDDSVVNEACMTDDALCAQVNPQ